MAKKFTNSREAAELRMHISMNRRKATFSGVQKKEWNEMENGTTKI